MTVPSPHPLLDLPLVRAARAAVRALGRGLQDLGADIDVRAGLAAVAMGARA
jgi:hypothetical protein